MTPRGEMKSADRNMGIRLEGWEQIARYLRTSVENAREFQQIGLPVETEEGTVWAMTGALQAWKVRVKKTVKRLRKRFGDLQRFGPPPGEA